ncbi:hypothetical protein VTN02DRAFT_1587 [Thermoascus thermophilus]
MAALEHKPGHIRIYDIQHLEYKGLYFGKILRTPDGKWPPNMVTAAELLVMGCFKVLRDSEEENTLFDI